VSTYFTPYSGSKTVHPGSRHGAFVELVDGIPVYNTEPDRPYRVLGVLRVSKPGSRPLAHSMFTGQWMDKVRKVGGNAVWIVAEQTGVVGYAGYGSVNMYNWGYSSTANSSFYTYPKYATSGEVLVLRIKSLKERGEAP